MSKEAYTSQGYRDVNILFHVIKCPIQEQGVDDWWDDIRLSGHVCEVANVFFLLGGGHFSSCRPRLCGSRWKACQKRPTHMPKETYS